MSKLNDLLQMLKLYDVRVSDSKWSVGDDLEIPELLSFQEGCVGTTTFYDKHDAQLIVAMRNNLGKLIAIIEVQEKALDWLIDQDDFPTGYEWKRQEALAEVDRLLAEGSGE